MSGLQVNMNDHIYTLSESRIERMLNSDNKKDAIYMGLWDKFKDFFRSEKKADVLSNLYDLLHPVDSTLSTAVGTSRAIPVGCQLGVLTVFKNLTSCAKEAHKDLFKASFDTDLDTITLSIGNHVLTTVYTIDVLKSITLDSKIFIDEYAPILRQHNYQNGGGAVEGADDLRKVAPSFYASHPELAAFLTESGITREAVFDRIYDLLGKTEPGVDEDKSGLRQCYFASISNHLTQAPS